MDKPEVDLTDPQVRASYRKHYQKRYAETVGDKEYVRKDKAHAFAFVRVLEEVRAK
jgi:hypothetical protein